MRTILALLVMAAAASGCLVPATTNNAPGPATPAAIDEPAQLSTASMRPADEPESFRIAASPPPAPAAGAREESPAASAPTHAPHSRTYAENATANIVVSFPEYGGAGFGAAEAILTVEEGMPTRARLLVTWDPETVLASTLHIVFRDARHEVIAEQVGESPMLLDLPIEAFDSPARYRVSATPAHPGATLNETVSFALTLDHC